MKLKTEFFINRAKKFGIEAPEVVDDKKKSRAERFGLPTPAANGGGAKKGGAAPVDPEMEAKKKSRAERFGLTVNQKRVSSRVEFSAQKVLRTIILYQKLMFILESKT